MIPANPALPELVRFPAATAMMLPKENHKVQPVSVVPKAATLCKQHIGEGQSPDQDATGLKGWDGWPTSETLILAGKYKSAQDPSHWDLEEFHFLPWAAVPLCVQPHSSSSLIAVMWGVGWVVSTGGGVFAETSHSLCSPPRTLTARCGMHFEYNGNLWPPGKSARRIYLGLVLHEHIKRYMLSLLLVVF